MNKTDLKYGRLLSNFLEYLKNHEKFSQNFTEQQLQQTLALMHICRLEIESVHDIPPLNYTKIMGEMDYTKILDEMQPSFEKYFFICKWFGNRSKCEELFTKVYTDGGMCYTFNSLNITDIYTEDVVQHQNSLKRTLSPLFFQQNKSTNWSLEQGYDENSDLLTFPARVLSSGSTVGLQIYLQSFMQELDYTCNGAVQGFRILLHSPDDVPSVSKHFVRIAMDKEILIAVKPKMITTAQDIAAYDPQKRRCYMNKDRQLKFFKIYTQNNCQRECLTNFTYKECGCVRFSMPRTADMTICGADKIHCYRQAKEKLLLQQFSQGLKNKDLASLPLEAAGCQCMPACTSLDYETELSEGHFDIVNTLEAFGSLEDYKKAYPGGRMSLVMIYFKENEFITSRRSELYGLTELLANFGGVFGLFMGISILSVVEMFYHCTLRLWSNMNRV
uniref:Pickpocket n=1 Tax=Stomoxys calcitrans TaxID=35570 RepID=A0A1I8PU93_STOCA